MIGIGGGLKGVKVDFGLLEIYFPSVFSNPLDFVIKIKRTAATPDI
jgi:hypothetical protein